MVGVSLITPTRRPYWKTRPGMPLRQRVFDDASRLFGVLAHPTRLRILTLLHRGEQDVSSLRDALGVPGANVSQHLALLRSHHVVTMRRQGARIFYALRDPRFADVLNRCLDILDDDASQGRALHKAIDLVRLRT
jgi:DNA-binding transcriptional ArsR family regulator